jgi:hypothetical protein
MRRYERELRRLWGGIQKPALLAFPRAVEVVAHERLCSCNAIDIMSKIASPRKHHTTLMNDVFFSLDQDLANKLVNSLTIPLTIDVLKPKYFRQDVSGEVDPRDADAETLASELYDGSLQSLAYAENRDDNLAEPLPEDEELYNIASSAVDAFLAIHPTEVQDGDKAVSDPYSFANQKGLWSRIKKYAKKVGSWLARQAKKLFEIKSIKLDEFKVLLERRPVIVVANPVKVNDVYLQIRYRITVKYKIAGKDGRVSFSDNFKMPDTDLDIRFAVNGLKYMAHPRFTSLKIVKWILGFKVTISLAKLVNQMIRPMQIFDAAKYIPEIPWFEKAFVPEPPLGLATYRTGLSFGVNFALKPAPLISEGTSDTAAANPESNRS